MTAPVRGPQRDETKRQESAGFDVTSACQLVEQTRLRCRNSYGASHCEQQRELLGRGEQDVPGWSRRGAGASSRRVAGAGIAANGQPISRTGVSRLRAMSTASALSGEM